MAMSIKMLSSEELENIFDNATLKTLDKGLKGEEDFKKLSKKEKQKVTETYLSAGMLFLMNFKEIFFKELSKNKNINKKKEN